MRKRANPAKPARKSEHKRQKIKSKMLIDGSDDFDDSASDEVNLELPMISLEEKLGATHNNTSLGPESISELEGNLERKWSISPEKALHRRVATEPQTHYKELTDTLKPLRPLSRTDGLLEPADFSFRKKRSKSVSSSYEAFRRKSRGSLKPLSFYRVQDMFQDEYDPLALEASGERLVTGILKEEMLEQRRKSFSDNPTARYSDTDIPPNKVNMADTSPKFDGFSESSSTKSEVNVGSLKRLKRKCNHLLWSILICLQCQRKIVMSLTKNQIAQNHLIQMQMLDLRSGFH